MPKYTFEDSENKIFELVPAGDYIIEVAKVEFGLSQGPKTRGSDTVELRLKIEGRDALVDEKLILHESCQWRVDTFVKSMNLLIDGRPPMKGEDVDFTEKMLVGLRGWTTVAVEVYEKRTDLPGKPTGRANRVKVWITNMEKLVKRAVEIEEDDIPF